jgi:hypothetical protein
MIGSRAGFPLRHNLSWGQPEQPEHRAGAGQVGFSGLFVSATLLLRTILGRPETADQLARVPVSGVAAVEVHPALQLISSAALAQGLW